MYKVSRNTRETQIDLSISYPAEHGEREIDVPCGFLAHMLELLSHRGRLGLELKASGDVCVDAHHLTEDIGIVLGLAVKEMLLSEKTARVRYGWCLLPMDGSLARVSIDVSGRGGLFWEGVFPTDKCGDFDMELVPEFFRGFCRESRATLHVALLAADNSHHAAEAVFKGVGVALDAALKKADIEPSTKGEWI
ncbi:MAG: imidazoleglycerol-phosphate dehydratase [Synergistaceae bacterium]|jgi:imidazoleglycerol-phosphate dehydratase|nr:imidazoleglycerol-phosphate dehydratase [Synergistaceae bacterium]